MRLRDHTAFVLQDEDLEEAGKEWRLFQVLSVIMAEVGLESRPPESPCDVLHPVLHFRVPPRSTSSSCARTGPHAVPREKPNCPGPGGLPAPPHPPSPS